MYIVGAAVHADALHGIGDDADDAERHIGRRPYHQLWKRDELVDRPPRAEESSRKRLVHHHDGCRPQPICLAQPTPGHHGNPVDLQPVRGHRVAVDARRGDVRSETLTGGSMTKLLTGVTTESAASATSGWAATVSYPLVHAHPSLGVGDRPLTVDPGQQDALAREAEVARRE